MRLYQHGGSLTRQRGAEAVLDLRLALTGVLECFRLGSNSWASAVLGRRIDRILFAATKADLLHHESHRRLETIFRTLVADAVNQAEFSGARIDVTPEDFLVLQHAGPLSASGMPEAGYLPIPAKLARAGVKDMVRISDARMSGTAYGSIVLHVTPDAASGNTRAGTSSTNRGHEPRA